MEQPKLKETDNKSHLTFTFQPLLDHSPKQTSAVIAEGRTHVVVRLEAMWHVDLKALFLELQTHKGVVIYPPLQTQRSVSSNEASQCHYEVQIPSRPDLPALSPSTRAYYRTPTSLRSLNIRYRLLSIKTQGLHCHFPPKRSLAHRMQSRGSVAASLMYTTELRAL